nr:immunoglobulin heavy chain junction region [Mus musculus]
CARDYGSSYVAWFAYW